MIRSAKGKKGSTIVFSIPNLTINGNILSWETFPFYSSVGDKVDENGFSYFEIPSEQVLIERDDELYKEVFIYCISGVLYAKSFFEGEEVSLPNFDLKGGILIVVKIPKLGAPEGVLIEQMEVIDA